MRQATNQQEPALARPTPRVRIVRAAPGSGKTWLVAEIIRQEEADWAKTPGGIAALSFTRVGGDEIRKAIGRDLGHPHFVGTIDSFLFRYVVRPFVHRCFPKLAAPRLIPADWAPHHWKKYSEDGGAAVKGINLFGCVFIGEEENGRAIIARKPHPALPLQRLTGEELEAVREGKWRMWQRSGCLSHSDAAKLASMILEHQRLGGAVVEEVARRFPLIIVDELQDTGYFLGKCILKLFQGSAVRGVLVGDPDQTIYEFTGACPSLFDRFETIEGAAQFPMPDTLRCPPSVAAIASQLRDSGGMLGPAGDRVGRAILVHGADMTADVARLIAAAGPRSLKMKVIARQNATVDILMGRSASPLPKLHCPALSHMHRAIVLFRQGRQVPALAAARAAIDVVAFGREGMKDSELTERGLDPERWKRLALDCLLRLNSAPTDGTLYDWQSTIGDDIGRKLDGFGFTQTDQKASLKPQKRKGWDRPCLEYLPQARPEVNCEPKDIRTAVTTVHAVKGETHDLTLFVVPDPHRKADCPSVVWWSQSEDDREERRIAYVAVTRTQHDLVVWVSDPCFARLRDRRKTFVDAFECMTIDACIASLFAGRHAKCAGAA